MRPTKPTVHSCYRLLLRLAVTVQWVTSCVPPSGIPSDGLDALEHEWQSLPGSSDYALEVLRSWRARQPPQIPSTEIWCVEVQPASPSHDLGEVEPTIWIVMKESDSSTWTAAWLLTMSALWAYESCDLVP